MDRIKKARKPVRAAVTRTINSLEKELEKDTVDPLELQTQLEVLGKQVEKLAILDESMVDALLDSEKFNEDEFDAENLQMEEYSTKVSRIKAKVDKFLHPDLSPSPSAASVATASTSAKKSYKLPKLELKKFSGELVDWLGWWAQFSRIHDDEELHASDKFQYLVQCMEQGSRARELVDSYPQSADNYPKVIEALTERFGNPKLLKQVYVRELINMIMVNQNDEKLPLSVLYDRLKTHLSSLESLKVTVEQMVEFLYPMVESSLPEETLMAWQRSPNFGKSTSVKSELDNLMEFLKFEIDNEEQRKLAKAGFGKKQKKSSSSSSEEDFKDEDENPTASGLFNGSKHLSCIFCEKSHESKECFKAQNMTLEQRNAKMKHSRACWICLGVGHISKKCKVPVKCIICGGRHQGIMCEQLNNWKAQEPASPPEDPVNTQATLNISADVVLQTVMLKIRGGSKEKRVRALLDSGSQHTYILKKTATELGLVPVMSNIKMNQSLFGGAELFNKCHNLYNFELLSDTGNFNASVHAFDEEKLCGTLPRVQKGPWTNELKQKGIQLSDFNPSLPLEIEVVIGADLLGSVWKGEIVQLSNGLSAWNTRFGWALMGKFEKSTHIVLNTISMNLFSSKISVVGDMVGASGKRNLGSKYGPRQRKAKGKVQFSETKQKKFYEGMVGDYDNRNFGSKFGSGPRKAKGRFQLSSSIGNQVKGTKVKVF